MNILAIETSCDETAMALVNARRTMQGAQGKAQSARGKGQSARHDEIPEFEILADVVASQIDIHRPYGGVVPSLAKREHIKNLPIVYEQILQQLKIENCKLKIDRIAVTVGPGLEPALWTGINFAKELSAKLEAPLVGVNHLEGHIYSNWLKPIREFSISNFQFPKFPAIVLVVSGGHTILLNMESMKKWIKLGETQDDAVGEAFDKVAKMLGLPYPGGPEIERLTHSAQCTGQMAKHTGQSAQRIGRFALSDLPNFPRPMLHSGDYNFSFSGLKTAVLYYIREQSAQGKAQSTSGDSRFTLCDLPIANICASFQTAAIEVLVKKTMRAAEEYGARSILLCGGVAANKALRNAFQGAVCALPFVCSFHVPELKYNTDNAAMIAAAAYLGNHYSTETAQGNLNI